jgi:hypothetical protein
LAERVLTRSHLNLVESSRRLTALDPGARFSATPGWLFGAGSSDNPAISNTAFRVDDGAEPHELLDAAREFFGGMGRGFTLWARVGPDEDLDLIAAAEAEGLKAIYEMPEMTHAGPAERPALAEGAELRRVESLEDAEAYWRIAASAYQSVGFPPEVFGHYEGLELLPAEDGAAFLGLLDGEPAGIAMTIVTHGVAGIYWVGSLEPARGRGLGRAVTAAAMEAGLALGAELASLQASHMGEPVYAAMGYETIYRYRLLLSPPPT